MVAKNNISRALYTNGEVDYKLEYLMNLLVAKKGDMSFLYISKISGLEHSKLCYMFRRRGCKLGSYIDIYNFLCDEDSKIDIKDIALELSRCANKMLKNKIISIKVDDSNIVMSRLLDDSSVVGMHIDTYIKLHCFFKLKKFNPLNDCKPYVPIEVDRKPTNPTVGEKTIKPSTKVNVKVGFWSKFKKLLKLLINK